MTGRPRLAWIEPGAPPESFPEPARALRDPNGLLAAGGDLSPARLVAAYRRGIFPWFSEGQPILWWCPDPRTVLVPGEFHVSRSLRRTLRSGVFEVSVDQRFDDVIGRCAGLREDSGTWLTEEMIAAYRELHRLGLAHSVEAWQGERLAGGLYGVQLGSVFFGESMFSDERDGSKVALAALVQIAGRERIGLIDGQVENAHLLTLGFGSMSRAEFLGRLAKDVDRPPLTRIMPELRQTTRNLAT